MYLHNNEVCDGGTDGVGVAGRHCDGGWSHESGGSGPDD